jgi:ABC-type hemin transport system ATPase subunit
MREFLFEAGLVLAAITCVGVIGSGATILLAFIIGELQRHGRKRMAKKKLELEKGFEFEKARAEMVRRERRLASEKLARDSMLEDGEAPLYIYQ